MVCIIGISEETFYFQIVSKKDKAPFGTILDLMKNMNFFVRVHLITLHTFVYIGMLL